MRIVAGRHRGRAIAAPEGDAIRPTSDRARQSLFNLLEHGAPAKAGLVLRDAVVLDVFCGTGALGLEALSRGAAKAILIDSDAAAITLARRNAMALGEIARVSLRQLDATRPGKAPAAANLAFLDPPYGKDLAAAALAALAREGWLAPGAIVTVETATREDLAPPAGFALLDERRYGKAKIAILVYFTSPLEGEAGVGGDRGAR
ncbi:MAG TPA: 16S rRNA (guanine(966)-N(2))-methyltransferase RsmD [Hypericibacter adhaerens]|jgi:16S rRNA (guanine966-N2)-methyltransferase|uniref:16S rRNA (guanine(966)-N(2))-methyltransferase RsmD n=1 Tax=Hypericibacter adhaerens TaxID=2602016 RepID=UPI002BAEABE6|nr:16S rRNA (guanine(966)-N(2))-methyltransferase RsmD [Hypericibacter adhaerens]HWA43700.1 16S rRNA (guanine(966)-N(2))-methyltransferase RsmD [Hypericibacter adhaerens]